MKPHGGQTIEVTGAPLGDSPAVMVMVHGRNAAPKNILDLVPQLDIPKFTFLAPAAADNTWYPHSFMADKEQNEPGLSSGLWVLNQVVADLVSRGIKREQIVLLGFSQGACLTAEFAIRHAGRYGGVIVFSGGAIGPEGTAWEYDGSFAGTPVFLGCSDADTHVPKTRVDETEEIFSRMGATVTKRIYPGMGHLVNEDEIAFARDLMKHVLTASR